MVPSSLEAKTCVRGVIRSTICAALMVGNTARCWPTRGALLTGYYPQQIRTDPPRDTLPAWAGLLPHHLQPLDYRCYANHLIMPRWRITS
jgi:hypothetical protein